MRIGIIGAGQLGQMLGFAARDLGYECIFLDPSATPPASAAGTVIQAAFDDPEALRELAAQADVVTYEFENVPVTALEAISDSVPVYPPPAALLHAQDRLKEKELFQRLNIPLAAFHAVDSPQDLHAAARAIGLPLVLKTRRFGYDGKGQFVVRTEADFDPAWQELGDSALIAEQWIAFDYEVSAIGARNAAGDIVSFPLTRNEHRDGILHSSKAPEEDAALTAKARRHLQLLLEQLDYVGVLALEMFVVGDELLANEFAPRVHNSGHWSIEGACPSQFTAHLLAITGAALVTPEMRGHAGMVNLIGEIPETAHRLQHGVLHDYGKEARPGRKLGHVTVMAGSAAERERLIDDIAASLEVADTKSAQAGRNR